MQNEPVEVTLKVTDEFEKLGVPYLILALQDEFYVDEDMIAEAIQRNSSFNLIHRETMFKVAETDVISCNGDQREICQP